MLERVENKRTYWLLIVFRRLVCDRPECCNVLFAKATRLYVAATSSGGPDPAFYGFTSGYQRLSRMFRTRGVIGNTRRAAAVLPCVAMSVP